MKGCRIEEWIDLNRLTPGRRAYIVRMIKAVAKKRDLTDVVPRCDKIITLEKDLLALIRRYRSSQAQQRTAQWPAEVLKQDVVLDRLLGELRDLLVALAKRKGTPRGDAAQALLDAHFAQGVAYYTQATIEEESERVGELGQALANDAERVKTATVDDVVAEIDAAHTTYAELIAAVEKPERVEYSKVKESDLANHRALCGLVAAIFVMTDKLEPEAQEETRRELLAELASHDAEISAAISARRRIKDVHPETGVPEEDDAADS